MRNDIARTKIDGEFYNADSCEPLEAAWQNKEIDMHTLARGAYPGIRLEDSELKGMKSIGYWDAKSRQKWGLEYHRNEGIEICLLESGNLDFDLNDTHYQLVPNTLTITRPWIPHKLGDPNISPSKLHWFIIDVKVRQPHQEWKWPDWIVLNSEDLNRLTDILRRNEQPVWKVGSSIKDCFVEIGRIVKSEEGRFRDSKIKVLINEILILLLELFSLEKPDLSDSLIQSKRSVEIFLNGLNDMLYDDWTLNKMADYCGLGVTQFAKYCQEITNATPMTYLNQMRLEKARTLLLEKGGKSVTDVAFECGYSSVQYFSQVFKKKYGVAPSSLF